MDHSIQKLTIEGFKSIKHLTDFPLKQLNIMIGANGSGKSNLVSFKRLASGLYAWRIVAEKYSWRETLIMIRVNIVVQGQTEMVFVKELLVSPFSNLVSYQFISCPKSKNILTIPRIIQITPIHQLAD